MALRGVADYFNLVSNGPAPACIAYMKKKLAEKEPKSLYDRLQEDLNVTQYT